MIKNIEMMGKKQHAMLKTSIIKSERAQLLWNQCLLSSMKIIQQHYISLWSLSYKEEGDLRSVCNMTHKAVTNNLLSVKLDKLGPVHLQRNQRKRLYSGFKRTCCKGEFDKQICWDFQDRKLYLSDKTNDLMQTCWQR